MKKNIKLLLGKKLKQLRNKYGYTQLDLAKKTGIAYKYIQRLEGKNPSSVTITTLAKIAKAFKMTVSKLLIFHSKDLNK